MIVESEDVKLIKEEINKGIQEGKHYTDIYNDICDTISPNLEFSVFCSMVRDVIDKANRSAKCTCKKDYGVYKDQYQLFQ